MADGLMLYGKRGSGKGLAAVSLIAETLRKGGKVATNLNLFVEHLMPPRSRAVCIRLPDYPALDDLLMIGPGNPGITLDDSGQPVMGPNFDESKNGLLVLDEVADYLNARDWQKKGRGDLLSWFNHSRKFGWDLVFIGQGPNQLDKQVRDNLIDRFGQLRRLDKILVPVVGTFASWFGWKLTLPRVHALVVRIGTNPQTPVSERRVFNNKQFYKAYDTLQVFSDVDGVQSGCGYSYLSHWHLRGRYMHPLKLYAGKLVMGFLVVALFSGLIGFKGSELLRAPEVVLASSVIQEVSPRRIVGHWISGGRVYVMLDDGTSFSPDSFSSLGNTIRAERSGVKYEGSKS